jgi:mycothiol synthase
VPSDGTPLRIESLTSDDRASFVAWATLHGAEHDDSFTLPADLAAFPTEGEIAALAVDPHSGLVGVGSLMVDGYREEGMARFRILHSVRQEAYGPLVAWILERVPPDVARVFLFLPDGSPVARLLEGVGFAPTRYAAILERPPSEIPTAEPPPGIAVRPTDLRDARAWAHVANAAFDGYPGRYPMTAARAADLLGDERVVPGGSYLALRRVEPVGIVTVWRDANGDASAEIATLAVVPEAQGQGIGRSLLRAGIMAARAAGLENIGLSTSTTNEPALALYISEGFEVVERRVCWGKDV